MESKEEEEEEETKEKRGRRMQEERETREARQEENVMEIYYWKVKDRGVWRRGEEWWGCRGNGGERLAETGREG